MPVYTPSHWPSGLVFLEALSYHPSVPQDIRAHIRGSHLKISSVAAASAANARPLVAIRPISETSHPAHGQSGLFATKKIPPRTLIIHYLGEVHCDDRPDSDYDLSLYRSPEGLSAGVDASRMGNEGRFVNDFRGVRPKPNAAFEEIRTADGELRMSVWSMSEVIKKGDEILVSYGKSWWRERTAS